MPNVRTIRLFLLFCFANLLVATATAQEEDILATLRVEHPRLYHTAEEFASLKQAIRNDPGMHRWYQLLLEDMEEQESIVPLTQMAGVETARTAVDRVTLSAGLYRITGDTEFARFARDELLAMAAYPDWNRGVDLGTAEMCFAAGVGYDWLYDFLTPEERDTIRQAIVDKALRAGVDHYRRQLRWVRRTNNWNQVCNAGLAVGALAIADEEPEIARQILEGSRRSLSHSMRTYDPDGGWDEGPIYWWYGTLYFVRYLAALETALGTDLGCLETPGFATTGDFRIHTTGPINQSFNFGDANERVWQAPHMYWLSHKFNRPEFALHESRLPLRRVEIFDLMWCRHKLPPTEAPPLPLDRLFRGTGVACFRSEWDNPEATYVGFKAGRNTNGHAHLDVGSFVLDALGERWAIDLGPERYEVGGYFSPRRWRYFRTQNHSHNTLVLDDELQNPRANAPIVGFLSTDDRAHAVADMGEVYGREPGTVRRGVALLNRRDVLVQDDLQLEEPTDVVWNLFTRADVKVDGRQATLSLRGKQINVQLLEPSEATFATAPASAPPEERQQPDVTALRIRLAGKEGSQRIAVLISPEEDAAPPELTPLDDWIAMGPVE